MVIPYALTYAASKQGVALRRVTCEKCGAQFVYALQRATIAEGTSLLFLDNQGAQQRAAESASRALSKALAREVDPVPCPKCGLYQWSMIPGIRRGLYRWMIGVAVLFFIGAFVCMVMIPTAAFGPFRWRSGDITLLVAGLTGGVVCGLVMLWWRKHRCRNYDPNADDKKPLRVGKQRVMLLEEFQRDGPQALFSDIDEQNDQAALSGSRNHLFWQFGLGLIFIGLGTAFLIWLREELINGMVSLNWPTASATVVSAHIATELKHEDGKQIQMYSPAIIYEYDVDGTHYSGSSFRFDPVKSKNPVEIDRLIQPFIKNPQFQVRYKPSDPAVSVIVPGLSGALSFAIVVIAVFMLGGLAYCFYEFRRHRKFSRQLLEPISDSA